MASVFVAAPKSPLQSRDEVYVAALPLRATRGPGQMLMSAAYSLNIWELQHYMVVIRTKAPQAQVFVFDFQPEDPENIFVALAALCRRQVPGVVLVRRLPKLPKTRCWFIGLSSADAVAQANEFNKCWKTELRIGVHDCRDYTGGRRYSFAEMFYTNNMSVCLISQVGLHSAMRVCRAGPAPHW